jgi:hypothetical protein
MLSIAFEKAKQLFNPLRHKAIKVAFGFLKKPKMTKIIEIKDHGP